VVMPGIQPNAEPVFLVATKKALEPDNVVRTVLPEHTEKKTDNGVVYLGKDRNRKAISFLGGNAYIIGNTNAVESFVESAPPPKKAGPLTPVLEAAASGKHAIAAGVNPDLLTPFAEMLPPEAEPFKPLIAANSSLLTVELTNK